MIQSISTSRGDYALDTNACNAYTNAELTIHLKLGFRRINPANGATHGTFPDSDGKPRAIVRWGDNAWNRWTQCFARSAEAYWSRRFWLVNTFSILDLECDGTVYRPNVLCRLRVSANLLENFTSHQIIDVVKLGPLERSFRSSSLLFSSDDMRPRADAQDSRGRGVLNMTHVHEVGHLLGLGHVDIGKPHCPVTGDTNAVACYGVQDTDKNSVMGAGAYVRSEHAMPWRRAMVLLTAMGNADTLTDWPPVRIQVFPRTVEEAVANKMITARPVR